MTSLIRVFSLGLVTAALLVLAALTPVHAQSSADLTPDQLTQISSTCLATQNTLRQLRTNDALLRVNRGQIYELMSSKLMAPFNTRLQNNSFDARAFTDTASHYMASLTSFRSDYQAYDQQMAAALSLNCTKNPAKFYDIVVDARTKRNTVHDDVLKMNDYIDSYGQLVKYLSSTIKGNN
jgi:hypothetical protein